MKRIKSRTIVGAIAVLALVGAAGGVRATRQSDESPQPWVAGRCYRILILDPEQQHTLRVVEAPRGPWVRVHSDPILPRVPGTSPRNYVWLNTASVFTVQQVDCSSVPGV